jgi:hypothetical protein
METNYKYNAYEWFQYLYSEIDEMMESLETLNLVYKHPSFDHTHNKDWLEAHKRRTERHKEELSLVIEDRFHEWPDAELNTYQQALHGVVCKQVIELENKPIGD